MLVSIIIPTYNRARTIGPVVESALAQTYPNIEVIVVDDGSFDGTEEALVAYRDRIQFIYQENAGPSAARNRGVAAAKGEILAFLDSDDFWLPEKIQRQIDVFRAVGPDLCCVICSAAVKDASGSLIGNTFEMSGLILPVATGIWSNPQEVLATRFVLFNQVVAVRRRIFEEVGGFNTKLRLLEDYELAMKLSVIGPWGVIQDSLVVKYNDEDGIGVECMTDDDRHLRACIDVMTGIQADHRGLNSKARRLLGIELSEMQQALKARGYMRRRGVIKQYGKLLTFLIRMRKAMRRRLPSWPKAQVQAI
jgi:glycosyltransferase involved in cell wall biosynthesis